MNDEIRKAISVLFPPDAPTVVELRVPTKSKKSGTLTGWFDDPEKLAQGLTELNGKYPAVYYTLNPCNPALTARCHNKIQTFAPATTGDNDIVARRWLLIDVDPVRPSGISSSDTEKAIALIRIKQVAQYLTEQGWPAPVSADSGNGYHLLYRLDLPNTPEVTEAVQNVLKHLAEKFDDAAVKVDKTVFNAARITKAYGTRVCKGESTGERPHRQSSIRRIPQELVPVTLTQLRGLLPAKSGLVVKNHQHGSQSPKVTITPEKVSEFLDFYGLEHEEPLKRANGMMWKIVGCPFNEDHAESAVFLSDDGALGFNCFHNSNGCNDKHWKEFRLHLEETTGKKFYFQTNTEITPSNAKPVSKLNIQWASTIKPESIEWLWADKIPFAKLTLFVGNPGVGKGLATMDISARASTGRPFPDCQNPHPPMNVLIFSSEDAANDTLVPRLMAAKTDLTRIAIVETTQTVEGEKQFSLDTDLPALRQALTENPEIKLVIIDPIMNHLGDANANREQEVRSVLTPLGMLAAEFKVAVVLVTHPNKKSDADTIARVGGAMAIVGCVRCAWFFTESKDDEETRLMLPLKANVAKSHSGLAYETEGEMVTINGEESEVGRIKWGQETFATLQESLPSFGNEPKKKDTAMVWLAQLLSDREPHEAEMSMAEAKGRGFSERTINRVKKKLKVESKKMGSKGRWFWQLPDPDAPATPEIPYVEDDSDNDSENEEARR